MLVEILCDDRHGLLNARLLTVDVDLWLLRRFVWRADAGELLDLTCSCLLVESLWITLLGLLDRNVNEDFDEW